MNHERNVIENLRTALEEAASSLDTIRLNAGRDPYLRTMDQVRGYAGSRWTVASDALLLSPAPDREPYGMNGIELIIDERQRQIEVEGWTPEHDDEHICDEMARAAACYAMSEEHRDYDVRGLVVDYSPTGWPWADEWWKPTPDDRIRELVKAGALIAAEIDRLLRAQDHFSDAGKKVSEAAIHADIRQRGEE